jgi:hypothetical protein
MKISNNKKASSISIVLLVILTIFVISLSLFYFSLSKKDTDKKVYISSLIESVYIKEIILNYEVQNIFEDSFKEYKIADGKSAFIKNFSDQLNKYKNSSGSYYIPELIQVDEQLSEDKIEIIQGSNEEPDKLILKLNFTLNQIQVKDGFEEFSVNYTYAKEFEKVFK